MFCDLFTAFPLLTLDLNTLHLKRFRFFVDFLVPEALSERMKSKFLKWMVAGEFFVCAAGLGLAAQNSKSPNMVIIMTDDQGYADVGFQGSTDIQTPNLDRLAAGGLVFENGYVCHPVCGPSRTGLMTGRYPHRFGLQENIPFSQTDETWGVPTDQRFFAKDLQEAGYRTGALGKWHLGATDEYHPNNRGFDYFCGFLGGGHNYFPADYKRVRDWHFQNAQKNPPPVEPNPEALSYVLPLLKNQEYVEETGYLTDVLTREAVDFIDRNKKQSFFLYLAYNAPHKPLEAKADDLERFGHIKSEKRRKYAAMIYAVDRGVGQVLAKLEKERLLDNTIIVYLSDNGGIIEEPALANNGPLRGQKGQAFEGGYHVPFVIHWPAKLKPGRTKEIISSLDLCPTFLAAAGLPVPTDRRLDGFNQLPFLLGDVSESARNDVFCNRWMVNYNWYGVREGKWKYYSDTQTGETGLYDLSVDIGEQNNLAEAFPEKLASLEKKRARWSVENCDPTWINPGWYWKKNIPHCVEVILSFEEEMAAHDKSLKE